MQFVLMPHGCQILSMFLGLICACNAVTFRETVMLSVPAQLAFDLSLDFPRHNRISSHLRSVKVLKQNSTFAEVEFQAHVLGMPLRYAFQYTINSSKHFYKFRSSQGILNLVGSVHFFKMSKHDCMMCYILNMRGNFFLSENILRHLARQNLRHLTQFIENKKHWPELKLRMRLQSESSAK